MKLDKDFFVCLFRQKNTQNPQRSLGSCKYKHISKLELSPPTYLNKPLLVNDGLLKSPCCAEYQCNVYFGMKCLTQICTLCYIPNEVLTETLAIDLCKTLASSKKCDDPSVFHSMVFQSMRALYGDRGCGISVRVSSFLLPLFTVV